MSESTRNNTHLTSENTQKKSNKLVHEQLIQPQLPILVRVAIRTGFHVELWGLGTGSKAQCHWIIGVCGQVLVGPPSSTVASNTNIKRWWLQRLRGWCLRRFHMLSWTVAATIHVPLTVFGVRMSILWAPPLLSIRPPTTTRLRINLLSIEGVITHYKDTQK